MSPNAPASIETDPSEPASPGAVPGRAEARPRFGLPLRLLAAAALPALVAQALLGLVLWRQPDRIADPALLAAAGAWIGLAASCCVLWAFGRRLRRRLDDVGEALYRAVTGDGSYRTTSAPGDELGALARRVDLLVATATARERRIMESALSDPLTGLPNRALLTERLRHALAISRRTRTPFAVAVLDLDRFKPINDRFGHGAGDAVLAEVARRLRATVRESDTVARLGGDEFVILLSGGEEAAREVGGRILASMALPILHRDQPIAIGLSIGIALHPHHGTDEVSLLRNADAAMYGAKRQRTGLGVFDGESNGAGLGHPSLLAELRDALGDGQFVLDWQPRLALASGRIVGIEGLLRWNHPIRGRVAPGDFIPFAEQVGIMREISRWVVREGARFAGELADHGLDIDVSVNISIRDAEQDAFVQSLAQSLRGYCPEPSRLSLELAEGELTGLHDAALSGLQQIAGLGVRLAVDDFGTGCTTVAQLRALPVHTIKIDRSFVSGMNQHRGNRTIVRAAVDIARQLGLRVTAEGVETRAEMHALSEMGCDEVQGYWLAKPMAGREIFSWIGMREALRANGLDAQPRRAGGDRRRRMPGTPIADLERDGEPHRLRRPTEKRDERCHQVEPRVSPGPDTRDA